MAMELVRIHTAQQYPTLFPGDLATKEKPYDSLATKMWTAFANLKHNTSPAIDGDAFASAAQTPGYVPSHTATTATAVKTLQRRRPA